MSDHYDSSSNAKGKCPYHALANGSTDLASLAENIEILLNDMRVLKWHSATCKPTPIIKEYVGNITQHASLYNQGEDFRSSVLPLPSEKHTPMGRLFGDIHARFRESARHLGNVLAVTSLSPGTQADIKQFQKALRDYQGAVHATAGRTPNGLPDYRLLSEDEKRKYIKPVEAAWGKITQGELDAASRIPMSRAQGDVKWIANERVGDISLGMYLLTHMQASAAQIDKNKVPETMTLAFQAIGSQDSIPKNWGLVRNPEVREQVERISAETYAAITQIVRKESDALKMAILMCGITDKPALSSALSIYDSANRSHASVTVESRLPKMLSSRLEAAAVFECMSTAMGDQQGHAFADFAQRLYEGEPSSQDIQRIEMGLTGAQARYKSQNNPYFSKTVELATAFIDRYRAPSHPRIARSERQGYGAAL